MKILLIFIFTLCTTNTLLFANAISSQVNPVCSSSEQWDTPLPQTIDDYKKEATDIASKVWDTYQGYHSKIPFKLEVKSDNNVPVACYYGKGKTKTIFVNIEYVRRVFESSKSDPSAARVHLAFLLAHEMWHYVQGRSDNLAFNNPNNLCSSVHSDEKSRLIEDQADIFGALMVMMTYPSANAQQYRDFINDVYDTTNWKKEGSATHSPQAERLLAAEKAGKHAESLVHYFRAAGKLTMVGEYEAAEFCYNELLSSPGGAFESLFIEYNRAVNLIYAHLNHPLLSRANYLWPLPFEQNYRLTQKPGSLATPNSKLGFAIGTLKNMSEETPPNGEIIAKIRKALYVAYLIRGDTASANEILLISKTVADIDYSIARATFLLASDDLAEGKALLKDISDSLCPNAIQQEIINWNLSVAEGSEIIASPPTYSGKIPAISTTKNEWETVDSILFWQDIDNGIILKLQQPEEETIHLESVVETKRGKRKKLLKKAALNVAILSGGQVYLLDLKKKYLIHDFPHTGEFHFIRIW